MLNPASDADHRQRPRDQQQHQPDDDRGHDVRGELAGVDQQAEQDEQADLRQPAEPLGERPGRRPVRQSGVGEHHRGQVGGDETAGVHGARRGERHDAQPERPDRVQPGRGQRDPAQRQRPEESAAQPDRRAGQQLVHQVGDGALRLEHERHRAEHQHEDDRGRVVEAGLGLQQAGHPPGQRQHAQHREHRRRVGRRHDGAEQQRELPVHAEQQVRAGGGDHHADHHAEGGERARGREHLADVGEARRQTALDQDDGQRGGAEVPGEFDVVELQAEAVLADGDADEQEEQQAGEAHPGRHAGADDAGEQHEAADQQGQVQLVQAQCVPVRTWSWRPDDGRPDCAIARAGRVRSVFQ